LLDIFLPSSHYLWSMKVHMSISRKGKNTGHSINHIVTYPKCFIKQVKGKVGEIGNTALGGTKGKLSKSFLATMVTIVSPHVQVYPICIVTEFENQGASFSLLRRRY